MGLLLCGCCFSSLSSKTNEIILIIANIIAGFFLCLSLYIIKWQNISKINLISFIIMLLIVLITLIFMILLRCWRSSGAIKTNKREIGKKIATAALALNIINLIVCIFEEIAILISLAKIAPKCLDDEDFNDLNYFRRILTRNQFSDSDECHKEKRNIDKQYSISYITLSYMEFMLLLSVCVLNILKRRIITKSDFDVQDMGREVVVVHQGPIYATPNNFYYSQNLNFGQNNINAYPNQYINPQQINVDPQNYQTNKTGKIARAKNKSLSSSSRYNIE